MEGVQTMELAIAIYSADKIERIHYARKYEEDLEKIETQSLARFRKTNRVKIYLYEYQYEYHYFKQETKDNYIISLVTNKRLELTEIDFLFKNIKYLYQKDPKYLYKIIGNPFGYTGRSVENVKTTDEKIETIQKTQDNIKDVMSKNIDLVIQRGEHIDSLILKTDDLVIRSQRFRDEAKKLNSCCRW
jgi:hypothetical protein